MKKFNLILLLAVISLSVSAQGIFTNVWYNAGNFDGNGDGTPDLMADIPYNKLTVVAKKAAYDVVIEDLDDIGIADIWDRLGDEQFISNPTDVDGGDFYDLDTDATFGSSFKVFYDDEMLYIVAKYVDANDQVLDATQAWEFCFQTRGTDIDRYEAGYQLANPDSTLRQINTQYSAFIELGAGKAQLEASGITDNARNKGQEGAWSAALGAGGTYEYNWSVDSENTIWAVLGMSFEDFLIYMVDEWGAYDAANYESLDPAVTAKIAFEAKSRGATAEDYNGDSRVEYWWSGTDNNSYNSLYWNGYLEFSEETFVPVSYDKISADREKFAFIVDNNLKFKGFDGPVDLEIYSIVGQKVMSARNVNTLNVSDLERGIYLVKVAGEEQAFKVMK